MTDESTRPSLKGFDANADRNGQNLGQTDPRDVGIPSRLQADLKGNPMSEAQSARIASGMSGQDASDQTEAETPPANIAHIGDAAAKPPASPRTAEAKEAIDRATAAVGKDEG